MIATARITAERGRRTGAADRCGALSPRAPRASRAGRNPGTEVAGGRDPAQIESQLGGACFDVGRGHFQIIVRVMRAILAAVLLLATGPQRSILPVSAYETLVEQYHSGDADEAVLRAAALDSQTLEEGFTAFMQDPDPELLTAAAAMHAEVALRPRVGSPWKARHFGLATTIVEIGTPPRMTRLGSFDFRRSPIVPVSPQLRRLWFLAAITLRQYDGHFAIAKAYLAKARILFPHDAEILLSSAITEEMAASNRLSNTSDGDRRKALGYAEVYLRESLDIAPDRLETRLRLGRVLSQRGHSAEARTLLSAVAVGPDARISYLAGLFLGGLEDAAGDSTAAAGWYARAAARLPAAQTAGV
jgi:hypothetical protein